MGGGASPLSPIKHTNGELDSPNASPSFREVGPQHKAGLEEGGLVSPKRRAGPELSSEDDEDFLVVHNNHFGSDDDDTLEPSKGLLHAMYNHGSLVTIGVR